MNQKILLIVFFLAFDHATSSRRIKRLAGANEVYDLTNNYVVALYYGKSYTCSGAIIGSWHILTSASCVIDNKTNKVFSRRPYIVAGFNKLNKSSNGIKSYVEKIYTPTISDKGDNVDIYSRDIAVLKLETGLDLVSNNRLGKLELPKEDFNYELTITADLTTFGNVEVNQQIRELNVLRRATLHILNKEMCAHLVTNLRPGQTCGKISDEYHESSGVCEGDAGGPIVKDGTVIGVASYVTSMCDDSVHPMVFTKTASHLKFIKNSMENFLTGCIDVKIFEYEIDIRRVD